MTLISFLTCIIKKLEFTINFGDVIKHHITRVNILVEFILVIIKIFTIIFIAFIETWKFFTTCQIFIKFINKSIFILILTFFLKSKKIF